MNRISKLMNRDGTKAAFLFGIPSFIWVCCYEQHIYTEKMTKAEIIWPFVFVVFTSILVFCLVEASRKKLSRMTREKKSISEKHPNQMWIFDPVSLKFLAVNKSAVIHYGYSRNEFLNMTILDIRPESEIPAVNETLMNETPRVFKESTWKHKKKNGEIINVNIITNDVTFKRKNARLIEAHDITALVEQQHEIEKLSLVAKNASNGVIISDNKGKIEWVNEAFTKVTGYTLVEVKGKHPRPRKRGGNLL